MRPSGLLKGLGPIAFYALSAMSVFCFLGVFFWGLWARNKTLIAAFGLGAGAFFFHAALTHAIPRYNAPLTPLVIISILWLCFTLPRFLMRPRPDPLMKDPGEVIRTPLTVCGFVKLNGHGVHDNTSARAKQ
jgi:hypothetical protein